MAAAIAKRFGWTYSRTLRLVSQSKSLVYDLSNICPAQVYMSSYSQFLGKNRKKQIQKQKKRYLNRINSLDPDHDLDMSRKSLIIEG